MVSLKEASYLLKVFQVIVVFMILLLEFVSAVGFKAYYYEEPTHRANFLYWVTLTTQSIYLLHLTIRFRPQWQYGPSINRIVSDCLNLFTWLTMCFVNLSPLLRGQKIDCSDKSGPSLTRCQLYLTNFSLGWIIIPSLIGSLIISIIRWNQDKLTSPSIPMNKVMSPTSPKPPRPLSYTMQKGVLDGQPVLIFNDSSNKRMSFYNQRNSSTPHMRPLSYPNNAYNAFSSPNLVNDLNGRDTDSKSVNNV